MKNIRMRFVMKEMDLSALKVLLSKNQELSKEEESMKD